MPRRPLSAALLGLVALSNLSACSSMGHQHAPSVATMGEGHTNPVVVVRELEGPLKTSGISSVESVGAIDLTREFPQMTGHQFRARIFTIAPGGVVARHEHHARPGYALILSGRIVEHRNDQKEPIIRSAGDIAIEQTGVAHYWENTFDEPVKALVVDIIKTEENS